MVIKLVEGNILMVYQASDPSGPWKRFYKKNIKNKRVFIT